MQADSIKILFVDDDPVTCKVMQRQCGKVGYDCRVFQSPLECLDKFASSGADIVVTDLRMPEMNGFDLLTELRNIDPEIPVMVMTGHSSVENAVEAMKRGAADFIKKPFDFDEFKLTLERTIEAQRLKKENKLLKKRLRRSGNRFGMIGDSPIMRSLFTKIEKVAEVSCNVIITGESGTGKELVAHALHEYSPRKDCPLVVIDCGALTETLLESELFGHEKGAFTGANQRKQGLMEQASGGTLFFDEVCNISDTMQMKLMRAIEDQRVTRVGGTKSTAIDLRIVAATNRNLESLVEDGSFRHDFYHRLNVVNIRVPSLDERREDIPSLVEYFVEDFVTKYNRNVSGFDSLSMKRLCDAPWPGNIRELRNTIERCVILSDGPVLTWAEDMAEVEDTAVFSEGFFDGSSFVTLDELEEAYISHVLSHAKGKKTYAAQILGIDKTTLWRKLKKANGAPH
ncbi:sigma-54-dependent transcriptional regulator [Sulfuriflexus mobilis]|uniref:sigma-54-dependent transcriptional regulator n=1 Tax=Sulfuriflexus mobilis TaxID=1811807 RepID=UPI001E467E59|nr:sigma-54 dependent transcriptional regulator [Sulfuriflexus mobilis]